MARGGCQTTRPAGGLPTNARATGLSGRLATGSASSSAYSCYVFENALWPVATVYILHAV